MRDQCTCNGWSREYCESLRRIWLALECVRDRDRGISPTHHHAESHASPHSRLLLIGRQTGQYDGKQSLDACRRQAIEGGKYPKTCHRVDRNPAEQDNGRRKSDGNHRVEWSKPLLSNIVGQHTSDQAHPVENHQQADAGRLVGPKHVSPETSHKVEANIHTPEIQEPAQHVDGIGAFLERRPFDNWPALSRRQAWLPNEVSWC